MATFAETMLAKYETLLQTSAGLDSVMVDGQSVRYADVDAARGSRGHFQAQTGGRTGHGAGKNAGRKVEMVEAVGIEPTAEPLSHKDLQQSIAKKAESEDPVSPHSGGDVAPDLDHVVAAWPDLPEYIKAAVMALVNTAGVQP